ncbi:hypothetical protein R70199_08058 [Paraburkholderia domus]|nr:hypothetical protein R70199_08058 [Paraburkholderia domus]
MVRLNLLFQSMDVSAWPTVAHKELDDPARLMWERHGRWQRYPDDRGRVVVALESVLDQRTLRFEASCALRKSRGCEPGLLWLDIGPVSVKFGDVFQQRAGNGQDVLI